MKSQLRLGVAALALLTSAGIAIAADAGRAHCTEDGCHSHETQAADDSHFHRAVALGACQQGRHSPLDEIDVLDQPVVLLKDGPAFQCDRLKEGSNAIKQVWRHACENPILNDGQGSTHYICQGG